MWLCLALLALPAFAEEPPGDEPAPAADAATMAEYQRLHTALQSQAERNAWDGVERTYGDLQELGVPLAYEDHVLAASAARSRGDIAVARERLERAVTERPDGDATRDLAEIDAQFGRVSLIGAQPLAPETAPFRPDWKAAIEHARGQLDRNGAFSGLLPQGSYTFGTEGFTVVPGESVMIEAAGAAQAADDEPADDDGIGLGFAFRMGGGKSFGSLAGSTPSVGLEAGVRYELPLGFALRGSYGQSWQEQTYLSQYLDPTTGGRQAVEGREFWLDARLGVDWSIPSLPEALTLRVGLEPRFFRLDNEVFTLSSGMLRLSGLVEVRPSAMLSFRGVVGWSPRLFDDIHALSAGGDLGQMLDAHVGIGLDVGSGWMLTSGWNLDALYFQHVVRTRHLAVAGVAVTL